MKLKKMYINNFRGLKGNENVIDFEKSDIIFLIGKNNTGKSSVLHAYNFFVTPRQKASISDFFNRDSTTHIEIIAEFTVEEIDESDKALTKEDPEWIKKWVSVDNIIRIKKTWTDENGEGNKMTFDPHANEFIEGGFGGFDSLLKKYAPTAIVINAISTPEDLEKQINDIIAKDHLKKLETHHGEKYVELIKSLEELRSDISNSDDIGKINKKMNTIFKEVFPDLQLQIYPVPNTGIDITKTLKSSHGLSVSNTSNTDITDNDLKSNGHGVIRQAFFSFLSTLDATLDNKTKEYLILFEEPELFLHPEAIFSLRKQLYNLASNSPFQVLCATHSPSMIDTSMPHSSLVRLVKNSIGHTKTYQVKFDIFEGADKENLQMMNRFNPHICESFYSDEVILVEGDTEAIVYRELISKYYSNHRDVFVLNTGSKSNLVFYQKMLTHFAITHTVVHDIDNETYINAKGNVNINAMWTMNKNIWDQIIISNDKYPNIARRFVHNLDFEKAHGYKVNSKKGKPLSAFEFAKSLEIDSGLPSTEFLKDLFTKRSINHSQDYIITETQATTLEEEVPVE